jgi:hypothetical protein
MTTAQAVSRPLTVTQKPDTGLILIESPLFWVVLGLF